MFNPHREAEKLWMSIPSPTTKKATGERCVVSRLARSAINTGFEFGDEPFEIVSMTNQLRQPYLRSIEFQFKDDFYLNGFLLDVVEVINGLNVLETPLAREVDLDHQLSELYIRGGTDDMREVQELQQKQEKFYYINDGTNIGPYHDYQPFFGGDPNMYPVYFHAGKIGPNYKIAIARDIEQIEGFSPEHLLEAYTAYALTRQIILNL